MNEIHRDKVAARNEAKKLSDDELIAEHSRLITRVEAMQREGANRLDEKGQYGLALETVEALHLVQSAHAKLTNIGIKAGLIKPEKRSGER